MCGRAVDVSDQSRVRICEKKYTYPHIVTGLNEEPAYNEKPAPHTYKHHAPKKSTDEEQEKQSTDG